VFHFLSHEKEKKKLLRDFKERKNFQMTEIILILVFIDLSSRKKLNGGSFYLQQCQKKNGLNL
jgi:hypothetical protein